MVRWVSQLRRQFKSWIRKYFLSQKKKQDKAYEDLKKGSITDEEYEKLIATTYACRFSLEQIMKIHGMSYYDIRHRTKAYQTLTRERKDVVEELDRFLASKQFKEARDNGSSDEEIWELFINYLNSKNMYFFLADSDNFYYQPDLHSFAEYIKVRLGFIETELKHKAKIVGSATKVVPTLASSIERPALKPEKHHRMLTTSPYICPFDQRVFSSERALKLHLLKDHRAQSATKYTEEEEKILISMKNNNEMEGSA